MAKEEISSNVYTQQTINYSAAEMANVFKVVASTALAQLKANPTREGMIAQFSNGSAAALFTMMSSRIELVQRLKLTEKELSADGLTDDNAKTTRDKMAVIFANLRSLQNGFELLRLNIVFNLIIDAADGIVEKSIVDEFKMFNENSQESYTSMIIDSHAKVAEVMSLIIVDRADIERIDMNIPDCNNKAMEDLLLDILQASQHAAINAAVSKFLGMDVEAELTDCRKPHIIH